MLFVTIAPVGNIWKQISCKNLATLLHVTNTPPSTIY